MFHLGGSDFPATRDRLADAVTEGLRRYLTLPSGPPPITLEGGPFPRFERARINLTGATARLDRIPPDPQGIGPREPAITVDQLEVIAQPLLIESASLELSLTARQARFDYGRDAEGRPLLLLADARDGMITADIRKQAIEALLLAAARQAGERHGVQVLETHLTLTQPDSQSIGVEARVKAKKLFVTAIVTIRGRAAIDSSLTATLSSLACTGEGMFASMACGVLQPQLDKVNNRTFPLAALSLGEVRLRDLKITVGESIHVTAAFGSQPG